MTGKKANRDIKADDYFIESDLTDNAGYFHKYEFKRKWGLVVRYFDIDDVIRKSSPHFFEFHLSYDDVEHDFKIRITNRTLLSMRLSFSEMTISLICALQTRRRGGSQ